MSASRPRSKLRALLCVVWIVAAVAAAGWPGQARAFVYWGDTDHYTLGRSSLDGQGASESFMNLHYAALPCGVAVSGPYIYWGDQLTGAIGRARIDGSGTPDPRYIVGATEPCGLAAFGNHLYWVNRTIHGSIGRADLAGPLDVQQEFVPSEQATDGNDLWEPCSVAVDATGIYWSDALGGGVGRANLDGTGERTLLHDDNQGCGVALGGGYVYWTNDPWTGSGMIGRALISGNRSDPAFITVPGGSCGLAAYSHYLFFANGSVIDATDLDSPDPTAAVRQIFMGASNACGVAVDSLYQGRVEVLGSTFRRDKVILRLAMSDPGRVLITQAKPGAQLIRRTRAELRAPGQFSAVVRLTPNGLRALRQRHVYRIRLRVLYTPVGGISSTATPFVSFKGS